MKRIILVILSLVTFQFADAEKPLFFIQGFYVTADKVPSDKFDVFCISLEGEIVKKLEEYLPCTSWTDNDNVGTVINHEREKLLLGVSDDEALSSITGALGGKYLITIEIIEAGSTINIFLKCLDARKREAMVMEIDQAANNDDAFDVFKKLADRFVEKISRYEICPYKGKIKVEVTTELNVDETKEYPVYCNDEDRKYKLHYKEKKHSGHFWTFDKVTDVMAVSYIDYTISEETEKEIEDGCYSCPQGKTRRYYRETVSKSGKIDEVSQESEVYGKHVSDARVTITFSDDGTYTMKIEATSAASEISETRYSSAESWCDANSKPPETIKNKMDLPLRYIFGPYKGTARDEFLTQHPDPVVETNPMSGEKKTYTLRFDLQRE